MPASLEVNIPRMTEKLRKQLKLSKQQALLLELLKLGYNNADIALAMKISEHTVKVHPRD